MSAQQTARPRPRAQAAPMPTPLTAVGSRRDLGWPRRSGTKPCTALCITLPRHPWEEGEMVVGMQLCQRPSYRHWCRTTNQRPAHRHRFLCAVDHPQLRPTPGMPRLFTVDARAQRHTPPVHILLKVGWEVVVDNVRQVADVQATRCYVSGHQHLRSQDVGESVYQPAVGSSMHVVMKSGQEGTLGKEALWAHQEVHTCALPLRKSAMAASRSSWLRSP